MSAPRHHWMLRLTSDRWSLVDCSDDATQGPEGMWAPTEAAQLGQAVVDFLTERQLTPGPIVLSLDSSLCLSTHFTVASTRQLRNRDTLLFQLEETLPVSAEEIVADFMTQQRSVFAVATEIPVLEPVVVELAKAGFHVEAIVPEIVLAVEEHLRLSNWPSRHGVLWVEPDRSELVVFDGRKPTLWQRLPTETTALAQTLRAIELTRIEPLPLAAYGDTERVAQLEANVSTEWLPTPDSEQEISLVQHASRTARRILDGQIDPPMQLLRGSIATSVKRRSPLAREWRLVECAAALLLIVVVAWQYAAWRAAQRDLASYTASQADVYRELYPNKRVPVGIETRLASDLRRLRGVQGNGTELPSSAEALQIVRKVLATLPADMRFRLLEIRVENGRLSLSGEVRSHGDADRIAAALRKAGLRVSPPSTQQLPQQGVDFRLSAETETSQEKSV